MLSSHLCFAFCSLSLSPLLPSRVSRSISCAVRCIAVYRRDRRWRNLPSDRHAVNEHVDRSRFPRSSCMACQIAITAATAIDIARGPTRGSCLPTCRVRKMKWSVFAAVIRWPARWRGKYCVEWSTRQYLPHTASALEAIQFLRVFNRPLSTVNFLS